MVIRRGFPSRNYWFIYKKENRREKDEENDGEDPLLYDALELMNEIKKASITMFQRRFKIGYNRAANLMDLLEEKGFVGPDEGTKPRKVYFDAVRDALEFMD